MSSPQSLFGLVSQLQHIEQKLTDILLEAAMKMSSLTDSSVFILVETQEGRKFSGKPHLCQAYRNSRLTPTDADVECFVDLNSKTINYSTYANTRNAHHSSSSSFGLSPSTATFSARKNATTPDQRGAASSRKRTHESDSGGGGGSGGNDCGGVDDDVIIEPVAKLAKSPSDKDAYPSSSSTSVVPLKTERDDNEIIFLRDAIEGNHVSDESAPILVDGHRDVDPMCGSALDLPLPSAAALEQSFEALFTQNDIQDVDEAALNFGAMVPCDVDTAVDDPSKV